MKKHVLSKLKNQKNLNVIKQTSYLNNIQELFLISTLDFLKIDLFFHLTLDAVDMKNLISK